MTTESTEDTESEGNQLLPHSSAPIRDLTRLRLLHKAAIQAPTLEDFTRSL